MHDEVSDRIGVICKSIIDRITAMEDQIQKIPTYNFLKRNTLRRQLEEASRSFSEEASAQIEILIKEKESQIAHNSSIAKAQQEEIQELSSSVEATDRELSQLQSRQKVLKEGIDGLLESVPVNQKIMLSIGAQEELISYFANYEQLLINLNKQAKQQADMHLIG